MSFAKMSYHIVSKPLVSEPLCADRPVKHCARVSATAIKIHILAGPVCAYCYSLRQVLQGLRALTLRVLAN